jgi:hypothetical protein
LENFFKELGGHHLRLGRAFLLPPRILELGRNFAPAFGGLLFLCDLPRTAATIIVAALDMSVRSVDNANCLGELRDLLCPHAVMVFLFDLGTTLGGSDISNFGLTKSQRSNLVSLQDHSLPYVVIINSAYFNDDTEKYEMILMHDLGFRLSFKV